MVNFLANLSWIVALFFYVYLIIVLIFIIMENRSADATFSWLFIFLLFPVIGVVIYILFGRNWRVRSRKKKKFKKILQEEFIETIKPFQDREQEIINEMIEGDFSEQSRLINILKSFRESLFTKNNIVTILQNGEAKFSALKDDLEKAQKYIHMEYFIWRNDNLTNEIKNILIKKAREGVEIRIIFDPTGSLGLVIKGRNYLSELRRAGVEIIPFLKSMVRSKIAALNNVNHQKIVIIDGQIGYTGGMNMGQEYIDGGVDHEFWRDTHVRIEGEAVLALNATFVYHWKEITKESLFKEEYFINPKPVDNVLPIQVITAGPDSEEEYVRQLYLAMISSAKKEVLIQSPYFIPDITILEALKFSALSGVDTKVMIAGMSDVKIIKWAASSYLEELLYAGVKIYYYNKGFLHAKTISVDSSFCTIGTTNMDLRSFQTSHEVNAVIFDLKTAKKLKEDFLQDLDDCKEVTLDDYEKINPLIKFRNSLFRLLSPLL